MEAPTIWDIAILNPPSSLGDRRGRFALGAGRHHLGRRLDRLDDVVVAGTATEVALEPQPDLLLRRVGVALEQLLRRHDHAGRAEAALEPVLVPERLLQGMQRRSLGQALDRRDLRPIALDGEDRAGLHTVAVELDGARPAVAGVAADMGPGEPRQIADVLHQQQARLDLVLVLGAIDGDSNPAPHSHLLFTCRSLPPSGIAPEPASV